MKRMNMLGTELELCPLCLGTGNFGDGLDREQAFGVLDSYVGLGGNFIDTANVYCKWVPGQGNSSEQYIGQWLKDRRACGKVVVATKGGHYDFAAPEASRVTREDVARDLEESLRTLGLDRVGLYWLHRDDESQDIGGILEFMEEFVREGKIQYYGASNFKRERLAKAREYAGKHGLRGFCAVSNQWSAASVNPGRNLNQDKSLVMMDQEFYRWHTKEQIPMVPFSSSAHGFFSKLKRDSAPWPEGKADGEDVRRAWNMSTMPEKMKAAYMNERNLTLYGCLCRAAARCNTTVHVMAQVYLLHQPFQVFPVGAVSGEEQLRELAAAWDLTPDQIFLDEIKECGVE